MIYQQSLISASLLYDQIIMINQHVYNSEAKQPEYVFINLFVEENRNLLKVDIDSQAQSQSQNNEQSQSQSQTNNQEQTTTIINCPPDSRCVIEQ
jgi:hypothetical protein